NPRPAEHGVAQHAAVRKWQRHRVFGEVDDVVHESAIGNESVAHEIREYADVAVFEPPPVTVGGRADDDGGISVTVQEVDQVLDQPGAGSGGTLLFTAFEEGHVR